MITFFVSGEPATAGSKHAFPFRKANGKLGVSVTHDNPKAKGWMEWVGFNASQHFIEPIAGPVRLVLEFQLGRPVSHFTKKGDLKKGKSEFHLFKPDLTKMVRAVEDGLTGIAYKDDSQVVEQVNRKRYSETIGVWITIEAIQNDQ